MLISCSNIERVMTHPAIVTATQVGTVIVVRPYHDPCAAYILVHTYEYSTVSVRFLGSDNKNFGNGTDCGCLLTNIIAALFVRTTPTFSNVAARVAEEYILTP